jgi:hypothetical protein
MKPYVCNFSGCFKRYKNLNGLKYHIEKSHGLSKADSNQLATNIVKRTNADYGINARSVPNSVLFAAIKKKEMTERSVDGTDPTATANVATKEKRINDTLAKGIDHVKHAVSVISCFNSYYIWLRKRRHRIQNLF